MALPLLLLLLIVLSARLASDLVDWSPTLLTWLLFSPRWLLWLGLLALLTWLSRDE